MAETEVARRYEDQLKGVIERASRNALLWLAALIVVWLGLQQGACSARTLLDRRQENRSRQVAWSGRGVELEAAVSRSDPRLNAAMAAVQKETEALDELELPGFRIKIPRVWTPVVWTFAALGLLAYLANRRHRVLSLCARIVARQRSAQSFTPEAIQDLLADVPWWVAPLPMHTPIESAAADDINAALGGGVNRARMAFAVLAFLAIVCGLAAVVFFDALLLVSLLSSSKLLTVAVPSLSAFACFGIWSVVQEWLRPFGEPSLYSINIGQNLRLPRRVLIAFVAIGLIAASWWALDARVPVQARLVTLALQVSDYRSVAALIAISVAIFLLTSVFWLRRWFAFHDAHVAGRPSSGVRAIERRDLATIGALSLFAGLGFLVTEAVEGLLRSRRPRQRSTRTARTRDPKPVAFAKSKGRTVPAQRPAAPRLWSSLRPRFRQPFYSPSYILGAAAIGTTTDAVGRAVSPGKDPIQFTRRRWARFALLIAAGVAAGPALTRDRRRLSFGPHKASKHRRPRPRLQLPGNPANRFFQRIGTNTVHYLNGHIRTGRLRTLDDSNNPGPIPTILDIHRLDQLQPRGRPAVLDKPISPSDQSGSPVLPNVQPPPAGTDVQSPNPTAPAQAPRNTVANAVARRRGGLIELTLDDLLRSRDLHVNLANASVSLETVALEQLRAKTDGERVKQILILAIDHDARYKAASRGRPSFRLYDLLAGIHVRMAAINSVSPDPNPAAELLKRLTESYTSDQYVTRQIDARLQKWADSKGLWHECWSDQNSEVRWCGVKIDLVKKPSAKA
jgi:hypothetical protein